MAEVVSWPYQADIHVGMEKLRSDSAFGFIITEASPFRQFTREDGR